MIGAFVSLLSLAFSQALLAANVVAGTLPITDATTTTPIVITSVGHKFPLGRRLHAGISGAGGMDELNGRMWVLTPLDDDTFSVSTFDAQGNAVQSIGVGTYTGGGTITYALPDGAILLGVRNRYTATMVVSPRVVMVPTRGPAWVFEPYGSAAPNLPNEIPPVRGTAEQQSRALEPQMATEPLTFEVYINGSAPNYGAADPDPDFADFDATQALVHAFYAVLFDGVGGLPRAKIMRHSWPSQEERQGSMTQRGQQWCGILEVQMPVRKAALRFVPIGTRAEITVEPVNPGPTDPITFNVPPPA